MTMNHPQYRIQMISAALPDYAWALGSPGVRSAYRRGYASTTLTLLCLNNTHLAMHCKGETEQTPEQLMLAEELAIQERPQ